MTIKQIAWICYAAALIFGAIDISKDPVQVFETDLRVRFPELNWAINITIEALLFGFALAGLTQLLVKPPSVQRSVLITVIGLTLVVFYGVGIGLLQGNATGHVLGDALYLVAYPGLFALLASPSDGTLARLRVLIFVIGGIVALKFAFFVMADLFTETSLSWRYGAKFNFAYLPMATLAVSYLVFTTQRSSRLMYLFLLCIALVGLVLANLRGFYLGLAAGFMFVVLCSGANVVRWRVIVGLFIGVTMAGLVGTAARGDASTAFGYWWGTGSFSVGLKYRIDQLNMLLDLFSRNPVLGSGLGTFDPSYEGFEPWLSRPYIVELEFVNLLVKLGMVAFSIFVIVFFYLFYSSYRVARRAQTSGYKALITGTSAGLLALAVASFTNAIYTSIYFHLYLIMVLVAINHIPRLEMRLGATDLLPHFSPKPR